MIVIADVEISLDNDSVFAGVEISLPQRYVNGGAKVLTRKPFNSMQMRDSNDSVSSGLVIARRSK